MSKGTRVTAPRLLVVLAKTYRALSALAERSTAAAGLGNSDFMVLEALLHKGPLTISEIQAKVLLASGSMTAAADRLEKKGLVIRKTIAEDRRARLLELTPEGRALIASVFEKHAQDLEASMAVLGDDERQQLYGPLKKLGLFAAETLERQRTGRDIRKDTGTEK
ncbi:MAG: MarR family transcriptional regulator [Acidobacteriaceae bacterium]|nr:MarR family transcriptional regulator [Acidobacteriaceae bacterium]